MKVIIMEKIGVKKNEGVSRGVSSSIRNTFPLRRRDDVSRSSTSCGRLNIAAHHTAPLGTFVYIGREKKEKKEKRDMYLAAGKW